MATQSGWTVDGIKKQVKRLRSLPRKEDERPWADVAPEFERVLQTVAENDEHTQRIADYVIDSARFCPSPVELRELAGDVAGRALQDRPDPACPKCGGCGQEIVQRRDGLSGARPCDCWAPRPDPMERTTGPGGRVEGAAGRTAEMKRVSEIAK